MFDHRQYLFIQSAKYRKNKIQIYYKSTEIYINPQYTQANGTEQRDARLN